MEVDRGETAVSDGAGAQASIDQAQSSETAEQVRQARFQSLGNLFDVYQGHVPHSALDAAVVRPVQSTTLGCLLLIDLLRLAYAANGAAEPNPDIDWHHLKSSWRSDNEYTPYESR